MPNGGGGRFKTIREEPDAPEDFGSSKPVVTKNNSFLQSYLANEMKNVGGSPGNGIKQTVAAQAPVHNRFVASKSSPAAEVVSKYAIKTPQETAKSKLTFGEVKSPHQSPAVPVHLPKPIGAKPMLPPPIPDSTPPRFSVKSSTVLNSSSKSSPVLTTEDRWKNKYDETEAKRKSLLIQSQKRESSIATHLPSRKKSVLLDGLIDF